MVEVFIKKIRELLTRRFVQNVATLGVGSFGGAIVQSLAGVVLARLLQPELFGVYALAFGLASIASVFLSAGTSDAIATVVAGYYSQENRERIVGALAFLLKITLVTGALAVVFAALAPLIAGSLYDRPVIGRYAQPVIIASIVSALFLSTINLALQVSGRIRTMSNLVLADNTARYGTAVLLVLAGGGVYGAMAGHLIGSLIIACVAVFVWFKLVHIRPLLPSLGELLPAVTNAPIKRYLSFSLWVAADRNISNLYSALPLVIAGIYISNQDVSYLKLAIGYLNLALTLLGPVSTLLNVEFPKMNVEDPARLRQSFRQVSLAGLGISTILTIGALVVAPFVFQILYGETYRPSVPFAYGLFAYGVLYGLGVGLGAMWRTLKLVQVSIVINLITLGIGVPLGLWLLNQYGPWGGVLMVTLWYGASHLVSFVYLMKKLKARR